MLRKVVVHAQGVFDELALDFDADFHNLLAHRAAGVRGKVLEGGRILGAGADDDGVGHGAVLLEDRHGLGDGRELLADGDVDADEALALLVDDRVDGDGRLAGLAVADDQLALAAPDRDQGVDGLDAGLDRRVDRLAGDDAGGDTLDGAGPGGGDGALVIERAAERIDHATDERRPDWDFDHATGRLYRVAFLDVGCVAENDRADGLLSQVEGHAHDRSWELEQLGRECVRQAVDLGDPVTDLDHGADAARLGTRIEVLDRVLDDADDLV